MMSKIGGMGIGKIILIIGMILGLLTTIYAIGSAGYNYLVCPDCEGTKDTFFKTAVYEISSPDYEIKQTMTRLETETEPEMISALRWRIARELFIIIAFWAMISSFFVWLLAKKQTYGLGDRILCWFVIPLLLLGMIQILGTYYVLGSPQIPFEGVGAFITNFDVYLKPKVATLI